LKRCAARGKRGAPAVEAAADLAMPMFACHKGRRIVDAVADHRDIAASLQFPDQLRLVLRQQSGMDFIDTEPQG
jgi:hypothetical protein